MKLFIFIVLFLLTTPIFACHESSIQKPRPFMGKHGEIFTLSDGSIWEVKYEYEYMYEYYPNVVICPEKNTLIIKGKKLNVANISGGSESASGSAIESNVNGSWGGWQGDTIVKLINGQIWKQVGLHLSLSLGLGSEVLIYQKGSLHYMMIEGENEAVAVIRLQ